MQRGGFVINALNLNVALFILSLLPQFTDPVRGPVWQQILILGLLFAATGTIITMGYGLRAGHAGQVLGRRMGGFEHAGGGSLCGFGAADCQGGKIWRA